MRVLLRLLLVLVIAAAVLVTGTFVAFRVSPYPAVWLIRRSFDEGAAAASAGLKPHVPRDVTAMLGQVYDTAGRNGTMDVFFPSHVARDAKLPLVVWVHGGAWVSGDKSQIDEYAAILAARGYVVSSVDYTIAPEATYPVPLEQVNRALAFLETHARAYHADRRVVVLAGDSAGSQIAAQVANLVSDPAYARLIGISPSISRPALAGMLLFCGAYDVGSVDLEGSFGGFLRTVLWAYSGRKDFQNNPSFAAASVAQYVTRSFPPSFITAGNADPLAPQSYEFANKLKDRGVRVDELFFPKSYQPALGHEYQFNLDTTAGREALERAVHFLQTLPKRAG